MSNRIRDIHNTYNKIDKFCNAWKQAQLDPKAVDEGIKASADACAQKEFVFATPLMKNLLVVHGDCKQTYNHKTKQWETEKLVAGKETKALDWLDEVVTKCLNKYNGPKKTKYNTDLPIDSREHYDVDCWLQWNKEKFWDIKPGQAKERAEKLAEYGLEKTNFSVEQMRKLMQDPVFLGVLDMFLKDWPTTKANWRVEEINDPFMSKKTGVSYPFFRNDSTTVPGTNITYGKLCIDIVTKAAKKGISALRELAREYNVYTGYPRNQRGKGRALEAMSRVVNLIINLVNGEELERVKDTHYGVGLNNEEVIRKRLIDLGEFALKHPEYGVANKDLTSFDVTVGSGWVTLINALRYENANSELTRALVEIRCACARHSQLIDGPNGKVHDMYGRTPSGYIDTTLMNTGITALCAEYANRLVDPKYSEAVTYPMKGYNILTLGDDIIMLFKKGKIKEIVEILKKLGLIPHEFEKDAYGLLFLQWRVFKQNGKWVMAYNWPRVLRSMLSKEDQKSLGPAGWTLSWYQQLGKLIEVPDALSIVVNIAAALDKDHLMLTTPVSKILSMMRQEDAESMKQKGNRKKLNTVERLFNSNPTLRGIKVENGKPVIDTNYFVRVQKSLKRVYREDFFAEIGFAKPDLSKVH